jgi:hypothetical protein
MTISPAGVDCHKTCAESWNYTRDVLNWLAAHLQFILGRVHATTREGR